MPSVSVVIPCYNVEEYISECIESVLKQTYSDLEIICVNDGSTDDTFRILKNYGEEFPEKIKLISQNNLGASAARNIGLSVAKGQYVQFLDADDLLLPEKIEHQMKLVLSSDFFPEVIIGDYKKIFNNGRKEIIRAITNDKWIGLLSTRLGNTCSNLWKVSSLKNLKGWNPDLQSSQEYDLLFRLLQNDGKVIFDNLIYTIVRERKTGAISQNNLSQNQERYILLRSKIISFMGEKNFLADENYKMKVHQILFDSIRTLAKFDLGKANEYYKQLIPKDFSPAISGVTTSAYTKIFFIFGFYFSEKITSVYRKFVK